ncbi:MAG TPA: DUF4153 domain-containing protein [Telluria sp.]|nr:DUF4153 domain-containing protein [Telluria sp.]
MQAAPLSSSLSMPESLATPQVGRARLLIGLLQGALLYWLYRAWQAHAWPATDMRLFEPLALAALLAPVILVSSLGNMDGRRAALWAAAAAAISAALGFYDAWRMDGLAGLDTAARFDGVTRDPSLTLVFFLAAGFFIAHSMIMAGVAERRRIASYPFYFESAWKLAVQLMFSALFVGVTWLVLGLGSALFMLVKLSFLRDLMKESWFVIPVIAFCFACALHLTDVRPAIVRGIRTLLLVLMSWILPVATLIVGGFLASLLFTGLAPLWATRHASAVLLGAAALLVILINAAWQNGTVAATVAPPLRVSARVAALLLAPIVAIALYALALRVADHGWTSERVIAAACLLVAACYAAGYAIAALRRSWLPAVGAANVATAFLVLAVLLALFSPLADPARLSVDNQLARLASGKVSAEKFDYAYLRFEGVRYGRAAIAQLRGAGGKDAAAIRQGVEAALKLDARRGPRIDAEAPATAAQIAANLTVWPSGAQLPASFLRGDWSKHVGIWQFPDCLRRAGEKCDAYLLDMTGDGKPEVIVVGTRPSPNGAMIMAEDADRLWAPVGALPFELAGCASVRKSLAEGRLRAVAPLVNTLEIDGRRMPVRPLQEASGACPK